MLLIAPGVLQIEFSVANVYLLGEPGGGPWAVVDTGMPGHFEQIRNVASQRFGAESRPEAIVLTHGHLDHVGSALELAAYWDVPVFAHRLERPFLTGAAYPPADPTVGGALAFVSRFTKPTDTDLTDYYRPLLEGGEVPGLPGWRWHHVPGHAPGQVALFRESDRVLIAGDSLATINVDSLVGWTRREPGLYRPPSATTFDWTAARRSIKHLATLRPLLIAAGHGAPLSGPDVPEKLAEFAEAFIIPLKGRYVAEPAVTDENGVVELPPPAPDPLPKLAAGVAVAAVLGFGVYAASKKRKIRGAGDGTEPDPADEGAEA